MKTHISLLHRESIISRIDQTSSLDTSIEVGIYNETVFCFRHQNF